MSKVLNSDFAVETLVKLTNNETKGKKKNKKFKGERMGIKKLVSNKHIKKSKKSQLYEDIGQNIERLVKEIEKVYLSKNGQSKVWDYREDLVETLTNEKFAKALCKVCKDFKDTRGIPSIVLLAVSDMFVHGDKEFLANKNVSKPYLKLVDAAKKDEIKKLSKKIKVSGDDNAKTVALGFILNSIFIKGLNGKTANERVYTFLKLLYDLDGLTEKQAVKIIKACYNKKSIKFFLTTALTEKPIKDSEEFSIVTNAILSIIEKLDKDDREDVIKGFAKRRRSKNNIPRRTNLLALNDDDYSSVCKTVRKLIDHGYRKEIFN